MKVFNCCYKSNDELLAFFLCVKKQWDTFRYYMIIFVKKCISRFFFINFAQELNHMPSFTFILSAQHSVKKEKKASSLFCYYIRLIDINY
jgi:hypothetical protein